MRLIALAALILPMAALAQEGPPGGFGGGRPGGERPGGMHGGGRSPTFISPVGKPYRGAPGEPYAIVEWFQAIDTNHDGYVTAAEFVKEAEGFFAELDVDHDGEITPDEITRYENQIAPETRSGMGMGGGKGRGGGGGHRGGGVGGRGGGPEGEGGGSGGGGARRTVEMPQGAAMYGLLGLPEPVIAADANFNRGVTIEEMRAAARTRFGQLDAKGAGRLRLEDFPQTPIERQMGLKR